MNSTTRGSNSKTNARHINLEDVRLWENFVTLEDVETIWNENRRLMEIMSRPMTEEERSRMMHGEPITGANVSEIELEAHIRARIQWPLNLIFHICAKDLQAAGQPMLGDGQSATWIPKKAKKAAKSAKRMRPDYAGFYLASNNPDFAKGQTDQIFNRIPGDAKCYRKIHREMLPPNGIYYLEKKYKNEAQKVLDQIHAYMDSRETRYGYIINDKELIFLRRCGTGWGHLDISPSIPHEPEDRNGPNSLQVLFYFHWKLAHQDKCGDWWLKSFAGEPDKIRD